MNPDFSKGLIPAIVVDDRNGDVLMLAYMDETAFDRTVADERKHGFIHVLGEEYWNKGATSGNKQIVKSIQLDCDGDTLLVRVDPLGPACHTESNHVFSTQLKVK